MLLLYCHDCSPRLRYTLDWICSCWGLSCDITTDQSEFYAYSGTRIAYTADAGFSDQVRVAPTGLLSASDVKQIEPEVTYFRGVPIIFQNESELGFDIFSAVFFMLSRYEEYLPFEPDRHGRFPAKKSLAARHGFLELPAVDMWVAMLQQEIESHFPAVTCTRSSFESVFTYDIDLAFKYRGKGIVRGMGAALKDICSLSFASLKNRVDALLDAKKDPWNHFGQILEQTKKRGIDVLFFFPAGKRTGYDKHLSPKRPRMRKLIAEISNAGEIGLHPSYYSTENAPQLRNEKHVLEVIVGGEIAASRQHYLRIKFPDTFFALIEAGIKRDYSMGFPDMPGFRAGTSRPFYFYDLKNEAQTHLQLFPSCCMDQTFIQYLKWDAAASVAKMKSLLEKTIQYGGIFIPIFHNHTFEDVQWLDAHNRLAAETISLIKKAGD